MDTNKISSLCDSITKLQIELIAKQQKAMLDERVNNDIQELDALIHQLYMIKNCSPEPKFPFGSAQFINTGDYSAKLKDQIKSLKDLI